jgi:hypothetical protein
MFRLLLILILLFYLLYKLGLFRVFVHQVKDGYNNPPPRPGQVNIDGHPPKQKKKTGFKGGEYIDYEEVK